MNAPLSAESVETEARRLRERLRVLSNATRAFARASRSSEGLFDAVVHEVAEGLECACALSFLDDDGEHFATTHVHAADRRFLDACRAQVSASSRRVDAHPGLRHVVETLAPFFLPRVDLAALEHQAAPDVVQFVRDAGVTSAIVVPLSVDGKLIGSFAVLRRGEDAAPFDDHDLALAQSLSQQASLALVTARLIEDSQRANVALRESEEAHRLLFDASPLPLLVFDVETLVVLAANEATLRLFGYEREEFLQTRMSDLARDTYESVRGRTAAMGDAEQVRTRQYYRKDGSRILVEFTSRALLFAGRRARITVVKDVSDRQDAERTRALLAAIVLSSSDAIVSKQLDGTITSWNHAAERLFGYAAEEAIGESIMKIVPPERVEEERTMLRRIAAGQRIENYETVRRRKDGTDVIVAISVAPILDAAGNLLGASKTARDLTAQRKAAEALQRTEDQLRQAQKMEAVGRLAGGVAHDFNNMLSVILSYSAMIQERIGPHDAMSDDVGEIHRAAERAAALTRQLLLFSRQQVMEPRVLDLNDVLESMGGMLRRILGEDIDLVCTRGARLGRVLADPGTIEQVVMNLVVNARDAMPRGGRLTIETSNVQLGAEYVHDHLGSKPGPHVMLAVTDTGVGMDTATQARIFEPFFTTKEAGKGTGLGLSTVFGIVQQCGGSVWVYSEPGKGSTFKVYLPRVEAAVDVAMPTQAPVTLRGSETVLLVEDQEQVRAVAKSILERNGYDVLVAQNAGEAILLCEQRRGAVHLLLTDVVMPQLSGAELARRLGAARPEMKVLYMSGYTDDSVVRHGVLESGVAFLQKPFTPESLTRKVREVLNSKVAGDRVRRVLT